MKVNAAAAGESFSGESWAHKPHFQTRSHGMSRQRKRIGSWVALPVSFQVYFYHFYLV
jgi:hypothetical protein